MSEINRSGRGGFQTRPYQERDLPPGWRWVRLGEVCEGQTGTRDPRAAPDSLFHYVDISSVDNSLKCIVQAQVLRGSEAPSRARQIIRKGDVLVATTRPNLNAVAKVPPELDGEICSTGFCVLRARADLASDYLFAFVKHEAFVSALSEMVRGALYPAVTDGQVKAQKIPLPPISEQRRIAALLNEKLAAVERARVAAQAQLDDAKALSAAYLRAIFPQPGQDLPAGWRWVRLGELCEITARQVDPKLPEFSGLPHVSAEDIESGTGRLSELQSAAEDGMISGKYLFEPGCVLYSKIRPYLRKVAIAPFRGLCSADMYPLDMVCDSVDPQFLLWLLLSQPFTDYADSESRRARMPKLNRDQLFAYVAPLPPLADQRRIAALLNEQMAGAEKLRAGLEAQLADINTLPAALLRQAFAGEL